MRITKKNLDDVAITMGGMTGRNFVVKPFPAPGAHGYNLVEVKGEVEHVLQRGKPARELFEWLLGYCEGYTAGLAAANRPADGGDQWGEDRLYPRSNWKYEVSNDDTNLGYWEWVAHQKEDDANLS